MELSSRLVRLINPVREVMANITVPEPDGTIEQAGIEQSANETRITNTNAPVDTSSLFEEQQ